MTELAQEDAGALPVNLELVYAQTPQDVVSAGVIELAGYRPASELEEERATSWLAVDEILPAVSEENKTLNDLTTKERGILSLLVQGATTEEITNYYRVSKNTVRSHLKRMYAKLDVANAVEATSLVPLPDNIKAEILENYSLEGLTSREHDVLRLIPLGLSNSEIAKHLSIKVETVKKFINHARQKVGDLNRIQLSNLSRALMPDGVGSEIKPQSKRESDLESDLWKKDERDRPRFSWEATLDQQTSRTLLLLGHAGFRENPQATIRIKDGPILQLMLERGIATLHQVEQKEFQLPQAVMAMLLGSKKTRGLILDPKTGVKAMQNVNERINSYIQMATKPENQGPV